MHEPRNTERLTLQSYGISDAEEFFEMVQLNKPFLIAAFPNALEATKKLSDTVDFMGLKQLEWDQRVAFAFTIRKKDDNRLIGHIMAKSIDWKIPKCELGYFISDQEKGKGYMVEAVNKMLDFCFHELNMQKVFLRIAPDNISSLRVAEKCGFEKEGYMKNEFRTGDDRLIDLIYLGLTRSNFLE